MATATVTPTPTPLDPAGDEDRDGLSNEQEETLGTNPRNKDTDSDGYEDGVEVAVGTNPLDPDDPDSATTEDADNDGVPDFADPDPTSPDSDGDGFLDFYELAVGSDATDSDSVPVLGEVNNSGEQNNTDAYLILEIVLGLRSQGAIPDERLDVNRDGMVDAFDAALLFQWSLGIVPYLPVETP